MKEKCCQSNINNLYFYTTIGFDLIKSKSLSSYKWIVKLT